MHSALDDFRNFLGCMFPVIVIVVVVGLIFFGLRAAAIYECDVLTADIGYASRWIPVGGCMIEVEPDRWIPLGRWYYRE